MKNGLNISGTSEFVHEICTNEDEAFLRFVARAEPLVGGAGITIGTLRAGTIRVARDFYVDAEPPGCSPRAIPNPAEYLLLSLGGCVTFSWIQGCTLKGITLKRFGVQLRASLPAHEGAGLANVRYRIEIDSDTTNEQVAAVAKNVMCFSPMHRTFLEPNALHVQAAHGRRGSDGAPAIRRRPRGQASAGPAAAAAPPSSQSGLAADVAWRYGAHSDVTIVAPDGPSWRLELDQPKQINGLDRAPNPQEYMMAALASELMLAASDRLPTVRIAGVAAGGDVDLRGFMNTGHTDVVRVHNIGYDVRLDDQAPADAEAQLQRLADAGVCHRTVATPTPIEVTVVGNGEQVLQLRSDIDSVRQFLGPLGPMRMY